MSNNYTKKDINRWLFSDENFFDLDGIYNAQNDLIWAPSREEADQRGTVYEKNRFLTKVIVWLGVCARGFTMLVILEDGTMDAQRYIEEVLSLAVKHGNQMLEKQWTYQ